MKVDFYGSEPHYAANVGPVWQAMPAAYKGDFGHGTVPPGTGPVVVSSYNDMRRVRPRQVIFMEHGTGQTYGGDLASYAGSSRRENVILFLCPNERVATLNRLAHPSIRSVVIGMPKLDAYWHVTPERWTVGMTWHWEGGGTPEMRTALPHYEPVLADVAQHVRVIGTSHPRIQGRAQKVYADAGIEWVDADEMYCRASVLVADNTSLGWDFIGLDRPVVWCNAPWYRRPISHGMRFWDMVDAGIEIDEPVELLWAITKALTHDEKRVRRKEVGNQLYPFQDGQCAARAADAIIESVGG